MSRREGKKARFREYYYGKEGMGTRRKKDGNGIQENRLKEEHAMEKRKEEKRSRFQQGTKRDYT